MYVLGISAYYHDSAAALLRDGDIATKKGPIFQTAILAGIMGAKRTSELIPLCHPLPLDDCKIQIESQPPAADGTTEIFITPGYRFRAVDLLVTNFHLPKSTLFMLVSAFAGLGRMRSAYAHAIANDYRFYSYGDSSLLFPAP